MKFLSAAIVLLAVCPAQAAPIPKSETPETLALRAAEDFLKALRGRDADAMLKLCEFPFNEDRKIVNDPKVLAKVFESIVEENKIAKLMITLEGPFTPERAIEHFAGKEKRKATPVEIAKAVKQIRELVGENGWLVVLNLNRKDDDEMALLIVRVRDGRARIAGLME